MADNENLSKKTSVNSQGVPEDSDVDRINDFVTSTEETQGQEAEEEPAAVEEEAKEEKPKEKPKDRPKPVVKKVVENKQPKKIFKKPIKTIGEKKMIKVKKVEKPVPKKEVKVSRKATENKVREKKGGNDKVLIWAGIGLLIIILAVVLYLALTPKAVVPAPVNQTTKSIAATVNGDPIYLQDVLTQYNKLNPATRTASSMESILNQSINQLLLTQEAKKDGIQVSSSEVDSEINNVKIQNGLSDTQMLQALQQQGLDMPTFRTMVESSLKIRKLLNQTILQNISISDAEVQAYYATNIDQFKVPAKVTVQHILIAVQGNVTDTAAKALADNVNSQLNGTNFCDLVLKYSDDAGSKNTCGQYTFAKGDFNNPDFENPSFSMQVNDTTIVKTVFGWHIIHKLADILGRTQNLTEVYDQINKTLYDNAAQVNFDAYISGIKSRSTIVNYLTKEGTGTVQNAPIVEANTTASVNLDDFAKCLAADNVSMYGASWCPHCNDQKTMFGTSFQYINYVECADPNNSQVQTPACNKAGISGYPTWVINGTLYPGEQTLAGLAKMTGCVLPTQ